jgi:hypothetical protein
MERTNKGVNRTDSDYNSYKLSIHTYNIITSQKGKTIIGQSET